MESSSSQMDPEGTAGPLPVDGPSSTATLGMPPPPPPHTPIQSWRTGEAAGEQHESTAEQHEFQSRHLNNSTGT